MAQALQLVELLQQSSKTIKRKMGVLKFQKSLSPIWMV
jgi:hypothetical protein